MIADSGTFNAWLEATLKARRMSQRQLANRTGIAHSTISRLIRGQRIPSLRTATSLAYALGVPEAAARLDEMMRPASSTSRSAQVEYALRSDESLAEVDVREIMELYLAARRTGPGPGRPASKPSGRRTPVPIVVQIPDRVAKRAQRQPAVTRPGSR